MRIGFDYIASIGRGGNATYSKSLIEAIISLDSKNHYYLYGYIHDVLRGRFAFKKQKNVHYRAVYFSSLGLPIPQFIIQTLNVLSLKLWAKLDRLDVFHFTNPLNFVAGLKKSVVTIHDLSSLHNQDWSKASSGRMFSKIIKQALETSARIIAVSEYTKQDLIKTFGTREDKISVVYEAADTNDYYPDLDPAYLKGEFNLDSYLLYVGQLQPRKNIINMLVAYSRLAPGLRDKYPLVLVGSSRDDGYLRLIKDTIAKHGIGDNIKMLGPIRSYDSLRKLYSGARALVYPSLFEGFGLPVLESLQCGVPVITSNTSSLPEVMGEAGIIVNPADIEDISKALERILIDQELYGNVKNLCLSQSRKFSWPKAASETLRSF